MYKFLGFLQGHLHVLVHFFHFHANYFIVHAIFQARDYLFGIKGVFWSLFNEEAAEEDKDLEEVEEGGGGEDTDDEERDGSINCRSKEFGMK